MSVRTTIVLLLLLLGLGAYVYWVEYPKVQEEAKKKTLYEFKPDDVTEVTLVYPDREISLKKSGDDWRLTKPLDVGAEASAVKNLVTAVGEAEIKKELAETASDLAQYGIDPPFVTVTLKVKDKELPALRIGKNAPVGASTYVQKADDKKVLLTGSALRAGLDKKVKDFRDKTILTFADKDVQKVEIQGDGKDLRLVQTGDTWSLEQPGPYAVDATTMRSYLSSLRAMRAVDFPDDQPADLSAYGLDQPRLKVTLYLGKDAQQTQLLLGKENDKKEVYVQESGKPTVYSVSEFVLRDLNKTVSDFRDKTVLAFDRDKITGVQIKRNDGGQITLTRGENKQWRIEGSDGKPAETVINQYLGDLHDLKGYEIAADHPTDLTQFGLDPPLLTLTLTGENNKAIGTILLGQPPNAEGKKEYAAMTEGGPTVFLVRDYVVTRLNKQSQDFVEHPPPTAGAGAPNPQVGGAPPPPEPPMEEEPIDEGEGAGDEEG